MQHEAAEPSCRFVCSSLCSYPGDYREEREGDGGPGCVCALVERQLVRRGSRPLIGQEAETYEIQEGPETCKYIKGT